MVNVEVQRADNRVIAVKIALTSMANGSEPWKAIMTALMLLHTREKMRLWISEDLIEKIRAMAKACKHRSMPHAVVFSLFGEDDPRTFEWLMACRELPLPAMDPSWEAHITATAQAFEKLLAALKQRGEKPKIRLTEALNLIPSAE